MTTAATMAAMTDPVSGIFNRWYFHARLDEELHRAARHGAAVGVLMHFGVALGWSAVFWVLFNPSSWIRGLLRSRYGALKVAALYGPFIWMVMSLVVIPLLLHRPPTITGRWWVQLIGHIPFVGLPIVWVVGKDRPVSEAA